MKAQPCLHCYLIEAIADYCDDQNEELDFEDFMAGVTILLVDFFSEFEEAADRKAIVRVFASKLRSEMARREHLAVSAGESVH